MALPHMGEILSVNVQNNQVVIYAKVNTNALISPRRVFMALTGEFLPEHGFWDYLGTVMLDNGSYVLHVFVEGSPK